MVSAMVDLSAPASVTAARPRRGTGPDAFWRGLAVPAAIAIVWTASVHLGLVQSRLLVPLERIAVLPFVDEAGRHLWLGLGASLVRLVVGFTVGATLGVALG